jgi:hypothetical protein
MTFSAKKSKCLCFPTINPSALRTFEIGGIDSFEQFNEWTLLWVGYLTNLNFSVFFVFSRT